MTWLAHFFGLDDGSGPNYLFWSGIGSDITELVLIGAVIQLYRRHNCGVKGYWRIGMRKVPGTEHVVCHSHHPLPKPSHQDVLDDFKEANQ
jgi:hypothetical protein